MPDGDGGLKAVINENHKDISIPGVREVVEAHEQSHLDDYKKDYPDAGREGAKPDGKPKDPEDGPQRPQELNPKQWKKWLRESEKKAWKDTLRRIEEILANEGETTKEVTDDEGNSVTVQVSATPRWRWAKKMLKTAKHRAQTGDAG